ncbi:MAG: hypothetical protein NTV62_03225 [Candidatus Gribaldobacteria bacterium]|nr:hypothetical protein [Candidatus Gribaldobacteria bacterium]
MIEKISNSKVKNKIIEYLVAFILGAWLALGFEGNVYQASGSSFGWVDAIYLFLLSPIYLLAKSGIERFLLVGVIGGLVGIVFYAFILPFTKVEKINSKFLKYSFIVFFIILGVALFFLISNYLKIIAK